MKWVLVILTVQGGSYHAQSDLGACQRRLLREHATQMHQAYCMSREGDVAFYVKNGKQIAAIR